MPHFRPAHHAARQHAALTKRGTRSRLLSRILLLVIATAAMLWHGSTNKSLHTIAFSNITQASLAPSMEMLHGARPQYRPQNLKLKHGDVQLGKIRRGRNQWEVTLGEAGTSEEASAVVSRLDGEPLSYNIAYDSTKSKLLVPNKYGIKRVAVSAANSKSDPKNFNMNFDVEGDGSRFFSFAKNNESFMYDASLGVEVPFPLGVNALYGVDAKRRATGRSFFPNWLRQSLGLQYHSKAMGDAKLIIRQRDPDLNVTDLDYEAVYQGKLRKVPGSPTYTLRAVREQDKPVIYDAKFGFKGPKRIRGGVDIALKKNEVSSIAGYGLLSASETIVPGIILDADAKLKASSKREVGEDVLVLEPINMKATADFATLIPQIAAEGSKAIMNAKYKPGVVKPELSAVATLKSRPVGPVKFAASGEIGDQGKAVGRFRVGDVGGHTQYEARVDDQGFKQVGEVALPAKVQEGRSQVYGRFMQSRHEYNGKPRLQLGLRYNVGLGDSGVRLEGENIAFDNSNDLVNADPMRLQEA